MTCGNASAKNNDGIEIMGYDSLCTPKKIEFAVQEGINTKEKEKKKFFFAEYSHKTREILAKIRLEIS